MSHMKDTALLKIKLKEALLQNEDLKKFIVADENISDIQKIQEFNKHVKTHLFVDDTIKDKSTYIFFEVVSPEIGAQLKEARLVLYAICHCDLLDKDIPEVEGDYIGNRADVLSQIIEDTLENDTELNKFGIGKFDLESIEVYNSASYYGFQFIGNIYLFNK